MTLSEERFDIFDADYNYTGSSTRQEVHTHGYWHHTFHCWIVSGADGGQLSLLFQKRHPDKDTHPGKYDITAAGHLLSGETLADGVRELEEELGLQVPAENLIYAGMLPVEMRDRHWTDREFTHVHLYRCDQPLTQYKLQPEEVVGLVQVDIREVEALFAGQVEAVSAIGLETAKDGRPVKIDRLLRLTDFVPHGELYYRFVLSSIAHYFL